MRVVVAGGGIAALEVLAGLRALAGEHELEARRREIEHHERETIEQLEAAGYLHHAPAHER